MKEIIKEHADARRQLDLLEGVKGLLTCGCSDDSTAGISATKAQIIKLCDREQQRQLRRLDRANDRIDALLQARPPRPPSRSVPAD
jgi:hypothetical protein